MNEKICVHGAVGTIGSSCVELSTGKYHLLLDFGKPLDGNGPVPFSNWESQSRYAVLISHSHADHAGFINEIPVNVPVVLAEKTKAALLLQNPDSIGRNVSTIEEYQATRINGFHVLFIPIDHSAPDACSILISSEKSVFLYTGDFRLHGKTSNACKRNIANALKQPPFRDKPLVMITEATNTGENSKPYFSEAYAQKLFIREFRKPGLVMIKMSNQNTHRLQTILNACNETGRILVTEPYTAQCTKELSTTKLFPDGKYWKVFNVPSTHTNRLSNSGKLNQYGGYRKISAGDMENLKDRLAVVANYNTEHFLEKHNLIDRTVWSMWTGYPEYQFLCKKHPVRVIHSSGHVYSADLASYVQELHPIKTVIVHTEYPEDAYTLLEPYTSPVIPELNKPIAILGEKYVTKQ